MPAKVKNLKKESSFFSTRQTMRKERMTQIKAKIKRMKLMVNVEKSDGEVGSKSWCISKLKIIPIFLPTLSGLKTRISPPAAGPRAGEIKNSKFITISYLHGAN